MFAQQFLGCVCGRSPYLLNEEQDSYQTFTGHHGMCIGPFGSSNKFCDFFSLPGDHVHCLSGPEIGIFDQHQLLNVEVAVAGLRAYGMLPLVYPLKNRHSLSSYSIIRPHIDQSIIIPLSSSYPHQILDST